MVEWEELRDLIKDRLEPPEVVEMLELTVDDLLDAFQEMIYEKMERVRETLDLGEEVIDE